MLEKRREARMRPERIPAPIAELQARYRLVPANGPFRFMCEDNPTNEVVVTFFKTDPPTIIAERGDSVR